MSAVRTPFPFIVGRGRSGTTLVRALLDSHPEMAVVQEAHFLVPLAAARRRFEKPEGFDPAAFLKPLRDHRSFFRLDMTADEVAEALSTAPPASVADAIRAIYGRYAARRGKARYGDKTPGQVVHIDMLARLFPEARFVHVIRDGRDSTLSYLDASFGPTSVAEGAVYWKRFVAAGRRSGAALGPAHYHEVRYEDLVAEPERLLREICSFIELPYDAAMLRYHERADELVGKIHHNLARPPTSGIRDWRKDMRPADVTLFEALAGDLLGDLGYERAVPRIGSADRARAIGARLKINASRMLRRTRGSGREASPQPVGSPGEAQR
ncbi:MAG: sulfotransferase family protein [Actinomycetota bacterium]